MKAYKFDENGLFIGAETTDLDPLETEAQKTEVWLLPPMTTFVAPKEQEGFVPVWDGSKWNLVEDHRGTEYWLPGDRYDSPARKMESIGALPEGASLTAPELTEEEKAAQELAQAKQDRAEAVAKLIVEVDGMKFDGDEEAQTRLGRTVAAAMALGVDINTYTQTWVLWDNTIAQPTIKQLAQALKLAGEAQTALWVVPYAE